MSGLLTTIGLILLITVGVVAFGPLIARIGGLLLGLNGLLNLATGQSWVWWILSGLLLVGIGEWLDDVLDREAPGKRRLRRARRVGDLGEPCPKGKVKYATEEDAEAEVARNQDRYALGHGEYRLERTYECPFCHWWHTTSQAEDR